MEAHPGAVEAHPVAVGLTSNLGAVEPTLELSRPTMDPWRPPWSHFLKYKNFLWMSKMIKYFFKTSKLSEIRR
jgi:hypothetical protein